MKRIFPTASLMLLLLVPGLVWSAQIKDSAVKQLMNASGLSKQVKELPGAVKSGLDEVQKQGGVIPAAQYDDLYQAINLFASA